MPRVRTIWLLPNSLGLAFVLVLATPVSALDLKRQAELTHLVRQDCGSCHGLTLRGGLGHPLVPETLQAADSDDIATVILDGVPNTPMPPWRGLLTREEARWIADRLKKGFPK